MTPAPAWNPDPPAYLAAQWCDGGTVMLEVDYTDDTVGFTVADDVPDEAGLAMAHVLMSPADARLFACLLYVLADAVEAK